MIDYLRLLDDLAEAAREAGEAILEIVTRGFEVEAKRDSSPVTEADRAAELIILAALARAAPGIPVIAEEEVAAGRIPAHDQTFFLVDPLDGTKEFVRGGDDYTVNIGLIEDGVPKLGVVFAPATQRLHGGCVGEAAWVDDEAGRCEIRTRQPGDQLVAVASKSHLDQATIDYLDQAVGSSDYVAVGSSLKFCIVAEGKADIYPRASPTSEWDTAAGHALLIAAGGLVDAPDGSALRYGKRAFLNRAFVATSGWKPPRLDHYLEPFAGR
jgi:3'(2'), 5'-bisphosphate nucleotidase